MRRTMKTKTTRTTNKSSFRFFLIPITAILLALVVSNFLVVLAHIPSGSMADTIPEGSIVLGSRLAYRGKSPERGDIIFFRHPETGKTLLVKRVIALPGDTLEIRQGTVYLNGEVLDEPYLSSHGKDDLAPLTVPEGKLIVLGDNREASLDARFWEDPFVSLDEVVGKAVLLLFPVIRLL